MIGMLDLLALKFKSQAKGGKILNIDIQIGDPDAGGIYVGKSATTGKDLHAAIHDERFYLTFDEARKAAATMRKQPGRENAHVPTSRELNDNLYQNRDRGALKGTFNIGGEISNGVYRSDDVNRRGYYGPAGIQWFDKQGHHSNWGRPDTPLPVRLVW